MISNGMFGKSFLWEEETDLDPPNRGMVIPYLREPDKVRNRILQLRAELCIESHRNIIEKQIEDIVKRKDNILILPPRTSHEMKLQRWLQEEQTSLEPEEEVNQLNRNPFQVAPIEPYLLYNLTKAEPCPFESHFPRVRGRTAHICDYSQAD